MWSNISKNKTLKFKVISKLIFIYLVTYIEPNILFAAHYVQYLT